MKKPLFFISIIISIIIVLSIVQVAVANRISTTGVTLSKLQEELKIYKKENTYLHERILAASSLTTISEKAIGLGFTEVNNKVFLSAPLPLALR